MAAWGWIALALAGCGGGGGGSSPGTPNTAPTVTLQSPAPLASGLVGTLSLQADADDDTGVAQVEFQVDGETVGTDSTAPYGIDVDTAAYASGQHVVRARAHDAQGETSQWDLATVEFGGNRAQPQGFVLDEAWLTGLNAATAFAQAPDGRLFVAEQGGTLRVVTNGALLPTAFLQLNVDDAGERGLLGVALHPAFDVNGWVYVYHTTPEGGTHNRISRFTANGNVVSAGSELIVADLPALSSAINHNGGALHFGEDGKLYVGVGENADPSRAQDLSDPLGKLLRFNDEGSIPEDNPFFDTQDGLARAVWAYGLRNPFTFAVQPGTGRIHINDVGANAWEEINLGVAGANYGWPQSEGPTGVGPGIAAPLFAYGHAAASPPGSGRGGFITGMSIAGGAFYPETGSFPAAYRGDYFFADFVGRFVARLDADPAGNAYAFARLADSPVDMLVGNADGALYVLTRSGITRIAAQ